MYMLDVTYGFHCTVGGCDVTAVDHHDHVLSGRLPAPKLPTGWRLVGVLIFCPRHTLLLSVDGQPQELPVDEEV